MSSYPTHDYPIRVQFSFPFTCHVSGAPEGHDATYWLKTEPVESLPGSYREIRSAWKQALQLASRHECDVVSIEIQDEAGNPV